MSDDQFNKLFRYMSRRFDALDRKVDEKAEKKQVDQIFNILDGIVARLDHDDTERAALTNQVNRHDHWIKQVAKKTSTKLAYES